MPIRNPTAPTESTRLHFRKASMWLVGYGALFALLATRSVPCGFAKVFHLPCPGCGSTRAVLALAAGNVDAFLHANPFGPFMAIFGGALAIDSLRSLLLVGDFTAMDTRLHKIVMRGVIVVAGMEVVLWIARFFGLFGGPVAV